MYILINNKYSGELNFCSGIALENDFQHKCCLSLCNAMLKTCKRITILLIKQYIVAMYLKLKTLPICLLFLSL